MGSRAEITCAYARRYAKASKKDKGVLLDEVVASSCWSPECITMSTATHRWRSRPHRPERPPQVGRGVPDGTHRTEALVTGDRGGGEGHDRRRQPSLSPDSHVEHPSDA